MGEGGFARLRAGQVGGKTCPRHVFWHASPSNPHFTKTHTKQKHHPQDGGRWIRPPAGGPPRGSDMPPACHSLPLGFESTLHKDPYQTQDPSSRMGLVFGGGRWIRTTEGIASRFTVCPLWPLGNSPIFSCRLSGGAGGRIRTPDLLITNQLLYLLSYTSVSVQPVSPLIIANTALFVNKYFSSF